MTKRYGKAGSIKKFPRKHCSECGSLVPIIDGAMLEHSTPLPPEAFWTGDEPEDDAPCPGSLKPVEKKTAKVAPHSRQLVVGKGGLPPLPSKENNS
jgi:hypothetical protein